MKLTNTNQELDTTKIANSRTCVIGQSGSGKSYFLTVFCEELIKQKTNFLLIDTEGEYDELTNLGIEKINLTLQNHKSLANRITKNPKPIIVNTFETKNENEVVRALLSQIIKHQYKRQNQLMIIIEEADRFTPQKLEQQNPIHEISKRGRKRNLGLVIVTQRPSLVNKTVLSQCNNQIIGRIKLIHDLNVIKPFLENVEQKKLIPKLKTGEFLFLGDINFGLLKIRQKNIPKKVIPLKTIKKKKVKESRKKIEEPEQIIKLRKKYYLFGSEEKIIKTKNTKLELNSLTIRNVLNNKTKTIIVHKNLLIKYPKLKIIKNYEKYSNLNSQELKVLENCIKQKNFTTKTLTKDISKQNLRNKLKKLIKEEFITPTKKIGNTQQYYCTIKKSLFKDLKNQNITPFTQEGEHNPFWNQLIKAQNEYNQIIKSQKKEITINIIYTNHRTIIQNTETNSEIKDKNIIKMILQ